MRFRTTPTVRTAETWVAPPKPASFRGTAPSRARPTRSRRLLEQVAKFSEKGRVGRGFARPESPRLFPPGLPPPRSGRDGAGSWQDMPGSGLAGGGDMPGSWQDAFGGAEDKKLKDGGKDDGGPKVQNYGG